MVSKEICARVDSIEPLTNTVLQVFLSPETFVDYEAGQYLKIRVGHDWLSYSIANAPLGSHKYELHIRHHPDNHYNQALLAQLKAGSAICLSVPFGNCYLNRFFPDKPFIFIAGGTGFAPIKAMIEQLLATGDPRRVELYWGARSQSDLYMNAKVTQWEQHTEHFRYFSWYPPISDQNSLTSLVLKQLKQPIHDYQIIIAGPPDMVLMTRDALIADGAKTTQLFSDVF